MKKYVLAGMCLLGMSGGAFAACLLGGSICQDESGNLTIQNRVTNEAGEGIPQITAAQSNTLTPKQKGQLVFCTDCGAASDAVCVSSGTGVGAYVKISSASIHCL
jgi:hypothetical protein